MNTTPSQVRRGKKTYVVIECPEKIPCDPCVDACAQGAISIPGSIIELPEIDYEKCTGCLLCIPKCPGLAIFVIDETPEDHSIIYIPYELLPRPKKGDKVLALDREGKEQGEVTVTKVIDSPNFDHCAVIGFSVRKDLINDIRFIKFRQ